MIQIAREGILFSGRAEDLRRLRREFDRHDCLRLPKLLEPGLLQILQQQIAQTEFRVKVHGAVGTDLRMADSATTHLLHFLVNDRRFFEIVQEITGGGRIGNFKGRVYRIVPGAGHQDSWHSDRVDHRMIALSINLSTEVSSGGVLQIRNRHSGQILHQVTNVGFGDAILFRIAEHLEHRQTDLEGTVVKTAFAGWFRSQPDLYSLFKEKLSRPGVEIT